MKLVHKNERPLFIISAIIGALAWVALLVATKALALIYVPFALLLYVFTHSAFISHLKGNAVELSTDQFPDLHQQYRESCETLEMKEVPRAYLMMSDGVLNALATKFLRRKYVVLFSSIVEALRSRPEALRFYFGHELAHIRRGHLNYRWLLFPASILPLLGAAYRRAQEYTCDLHGLAASKSREDALAALAVLGTGGERLGQVNTEKFIGQKIETGQFWMSFHELTGDYPWLTKRLAAVAGDATSNPRRHVGAWLLSAFVPRLGLGGVGGGASALVTIAILGILAAIAIPAYQDYTVRSQVAATLDAAAPIKAAVTGFIEQSDAYPGSLADVGVPEAFPAGPISEAAISDEGIEVVIRAAHARANGQTIVFSAYRADDGSIGWDCTGGSLDDKYRPAGCRGGPR